MTHIDRAGLSVAKELAIFIEAEVLPGLGIEANGFWTGVADIFARFTPENRALLASASRAKKSGWFKQVGWMEHVGREILGPGLAEFQQPGRDQFIRIYDWLAKGS